MQKQINFFVNCIPPKSTHQSGLRIIRRHDGTQFIGKFAKSAAKRAQDDLINLIAPFRPPAPLKGALLVRIEWFYQFRKSESKKNIERGFIPCDTRPDCDNLIKGLCDILTRLGFWRDDAQIAEITFRKFWAIKPGIEIKIKEIEAE
ncbi:MAG: RusA family crossover junction endodeoxyribonuclease [Smithella sp.]|jgi:Holliday junction resolvase RusA-like endonuclease